MVSEGLGVVRRQWWLGVLISLAAAAVLAGLLGAGPARSLLAGALSVLLGNLAAGWVAFRHQAPSANVAAMAFVVSALLRWAVTGGLVVLAYLADPAGAPWILGGILIGILAGVIAALTFKRR